LKIAIYSLCKNEEHNIKSWMAHVQDADYIIVGDTGSTDGSTALLSAEGAIVYPIAITPWRFDVARNRLLQLIPDDVDVCISLDFDERLCVGWRKMIEDVWEHASTRLSYQYTEIEETIPPTMTTITSSRIHHRHHYEWLYPVHELLNYVGADKEVAATSSVLSIIHRPKKSKNRDSYLQLMELAVAEHPEDARLRHQLGRDYLKHGLWDKGIVALTRNIDMKHAPLEQKFACRRLIARALAEKNEYQRALSILKELIRENPLCSSSYVEYIFIAYKKNNWQDILKLSSALSNINYQYNSLYNEFKNAKFNIYDILAMAYYKVNNYELALQCAETALAIAPNEKRVEKNVIYFKHMCNKL